MMHVPEKYRYQKQIELYSDITYGNNGFFVIPHERIANHYYQIQASDGESWEHVSVSIFKHNEKPSRCPTWQEMCYIKDLFWDETDTVIQYHPAKEDYVNMHPFVLHLWKPTNQEIPKPDKIMVGI